MDKQPDDKFGDLDKRLHHLEESFDTRVDLRVSESARELQKADGALDGEIRHTKGQLSILVTSGVVSFFLAIGGITWLANKALEVQTSLSGVESKVGTLLAEAGKKVSEVGDAERKKIEAAAQAQQQQVDRLQREAAARQQTLQQAPQAQAVPPSAFTCITKVAVTPAAVLYPTVVASLDAAEVQAGYQIVSGGCSVPAAGQEGVRHNIPIIRSAPDASARGWACAAGDPPNIPVPARLTAYAIACRFAAK
jgi:phage-related tail fiber protein